VVTREEGDVFPFLFFWPDQARFAGVVTISETVFGRRKRAFRPHHNRGHGVD